MKMEKKNRMSNEELVRLIKQGDKSKVGELWEQNKALCSKIASRYYPLCKYAGMEEEDLLQEAFFGFSKAIDAYKEDSGNLFSTYLTFNIWNACQKALGIRGDHARLNHPYSLNSIAVEANNSDRTLEFVDILADDYDDRKQKEDEIYWEQFEDMLLNASEHLDETDKKLIYYRYIKGYTLREMTDVMEMTTQGISSRNKSVLRKLRRSGKLKRFLEEEK